MQKRYAVRLLKNLLSELDIEEELSQIGYYPIYSLWDVSKFLKYKNIKNFIIELEVDNTTNLIFPFLCQNSVGVIVLVQSKCPDGLWVYNPILNRNVLISYASFNTKYGNKLLLLEKIETNYSLRKKSHSNVYIYLHFTIPLVLIFIFIKHEYFLGVIGIINSLGFALSLAYTRNEFGARTPLFDIVCNSTSSCSSHDLYNSKIPFSLLSLVYFSLNIGFVLLSFAFNLKISNVLFIVLASIGILFSIISLLYQYFILKSFCKICLSISALVLIYFLIVIKNNSAWELDGFTFFSIFGMIIFGFIATLIVKQYRTLLKTLTDYNMLKNKTFSIWTNKEVIDKMLIISNPSIVLPSSTIEIGNPNGSIKLILILKVIR